MEKPEEGLDVELPWVSDNYHQTLGIPLIAGRYFAASDTATATKVVIVNENLRGTTSRLRKMRSAIQSVVLTILKPASVIVGVVAMQSTHRCVMRRRLRCIVRSCNAKSLRRSILVRTWQPPPRLPPSIRGAIANIDSKLIVNDLTTMTTQIDDTIASERTIAMLAAVFGSLATILAGIGLYGMLAYSIAQRTREFGIRMALGARQFSVIRLVMQRNHDPGRRCNCGHDSAFHPADENTAEPAVQRLDRGPWNLRNRDIGCRLHGFARRNDSRTQSGFDRSCNRAANGVAPRLAEDVGVKEFVTKLSLGIVLLAELDEVVDARIFRSQLLRRHGEEFPPMRTRIVGRERFFNKRQKPFHFRPFLFPGEMDGDAGLIMAGTHP